MKIEVSKLRSNPFRNLTRLPLDQDKVNALVHSIKDTSFWDNLIGREADGGVEIAYGHHRVAALKKVGVKTIDINVRPLTDTEMVKIMSHENMGEWSHDAEFETETVRTVLEAAAAGKVELPKCRGTGTARSLSTPQGTLSYSAETLAKFLGWKQYKVEAALGAIEAAAEGIVDPDDLKDLSSKQAQVVVQQAKRIAKTHGKQTGKAVAKTLSGGMRKGSGGRYKATDQKKKAITIHDAKQIADELVAVPEAKAKKPMPDIDKFAFDLSGDIFNLLGGKLGEKMEQVCKHSQHLSAERRRELRRALEALVRRATKFIEELK